MTLTRKAIEEAISDVQDGNENRHNRGCSILIELAQEYLAIKGMPEELIKTGDTETDVRVDVYNRLLHLCRLAHKILKKEENDLENKLCAILRAYVGETGKSEGAVDVLLRLEDELLKYRRGKGKIPKNGWTEKELDAILPKKKEKIIEECNCAKNDITCPHCTEVLVYNQAIDDCKQALLSGKEGEGR